MDKPLIHLYQIFHTFQDFLDLSREPYINASITQDHLSIDQLFSVLFCRTFASTLGGSASQ